MPWRGPEYEGEFPSLGPLIVQWIETFLCHGPGDIIGESVVLDEEFYEFIVRAYQLNPEDGRRVKRRAFLSRAKGRAKSELAGMLSCAEGLAPVRFAGWDADGEPVGKPVSSPYIRCLATEENQSGNTFDNVSVMMAHIADRFGDEYPGIDFGRTSQSSTRVILHHQHGEIVPSTSSGSSKDGGKETFAVFDEVHLYNTPELRRMHATVGRNLGKRKIAEPWSLETSTMYRPGENSVAEGTHKYAQDIASGRITDDRSLLFDHKQAPDDVDISSRSSLLAGLKAAYGPAAEWMDLDGIIAQIRDPQADPSDSRRYWLNQLVSSSDSWIDHVDWAACAQMDVIADRETVCLGFDGAVRDDSTALVACRVSDGHLQLLGCWERPEGALGEGWQVDREAVDAAVARAFDRYDVVGFYGDPPHWQDYMDRWQRDFGAKLRVKATQERPIEWWTNRPKAMVDALGRFQEGVLGKLLTHDGDTVLTRHVLNARRRHSRSGLQISKEHPSSIRKIDAAMAAVLAYEARADAVAKGVTRTRQRSNTLRRF